MKVISIINLKGGVGKSITSINLAYCLAQNGSRVLLLDNDKQGNSTKFYGCHSYEHKSLSEVLLGTAEIREVIKHTSCEKLDIVPANMTLLKANRDVLLETTRPQHIRIKEALEHVAAEYDYCIIDNAPDINISVVNALVASDDVIIPVKVDAFTFDGIAEIMEQMQDIRKYYNPSLNFAGCLVTSYRNNDVNNEGVKALQKKYGKVYNTKIRWTAKVDESTFSGVPITDYSRRCGASKDYIQFTEEYVKGEGQA